MTFVKKSREVEINAPFLGTILTTTVPFLPAPSACRRRRRVCDFENMDSSLIAPNADLALIGPKGYTINLSLVDASPELLDQSARPRIPYPNQRPRFARRRQQSSTR